MRGLAVLFTVLLLTTGVASIARAQASEVDPDLSRAETLREAGDHAGALAAFSAAWQHSASRRALAGMAVEELALEHYVAAEAHAVDALAFVGDPELAPIAETLAHVRDEAASHLGSVDVVCPEGCAITLDGVAAGTTPLAHMVRATVGTHVIHAELDHHTPADASVEVTAGAVTRAVLAPVYIDDRPVLQRTGGTGDGERIAGVVAMGVGGLSLIIGAVALGVELDRDSYLRSDACAPTLMGQAREQVCPDAASTRGTYSDVARNLLLLGGGLLLTGFVFFVTAPSDPQTPAVSCAPSLAPGFACQGRF